ncbi:hypothetical protein TIFTF001_002455 [Ficus carica]|uniref:Uncharacterized protein n=1 Tax=Ficus carica TaxID=3494 RepID=A0AA87ZBK6_FICCA|nr:hypothetical protein TIFTF001_002455 [Ficus carica]
MSDETSVLKPPRQQCLEKVGPSDRCSRRGDVINPLLPVVLSRESVNERYIPSKTSSVFVSPHKTQNSKPKFSKLENFLPSSHRVLGQNIAQPCDVTIRAISNNPSLLFDQFLRFSLP